MKLRQKSPWHACLCFEALLDFLLSSFPSSTEALWFARVLCVLSTFAFLTFAVSDLFFLRSFISSFNSFARSGNSFSRMLILSHREAPVSIILRVQSAQNSRKDFQSAEKAVPIKTKVIFILIDREASAATPSSYRLSLHLDSTKLCRRNQYRVVSFPICNLRQRFKSGHIYHLVAKPTFLPCVYASSSRLSKKSFKIALLDSTKIRHYLPPPRLAPAGQKMDTRPCGKAGLSSMLVYCLWASLLQYRATLQTLHLSMIASFAQI